MTSLPVIFLFGRHSFEHPPPGSDFDALPLPWGALHLRAYACPAWRVMSIAPAGSSSNSVHLKKKKKKKKKGQAAHSQFAEELGAGKGGGGGYGARAIRLCFSVSLFLSLPHYLSLSMLIYFFKFFYHSTNWAQTQRSLWLCMTCGREGARSKRSEDIGHIPTLRSKVSAASTFTAV